MLKQDIGAGVVKLGTQIDVRKDFPELLCIGSCAEIVGMLSESQSYEIKWDILQICIFFTVSSRSYTKNVIVPITLSQVEPDKIELLEFENLILKRTIERFGIQTIQHPSLTGL